VENATSGDRGGHGDLCRNAVVLENSVELRRPRAEVFDYCSDIRNEREWNPTMRSVELLTPGPLRVGSVYRARWKGGPANTLECVKFDRPSCWVHDSVSKMWRVRFEGRVLETADGSRLLTRMEISPVAFGKLFMPVFRRFMVRQERANMHHIRRAMEAGPATRHAREGPRITYQTRRRVTRSAEDAFEVIGTHVYDNHPRWEPQVLEIRSITPGPVGVGSRAVMVRRDYGRRSEVLYEVTEFQPPRRIAFHHPDAGMDFEIRFDLTPLDDRSCELSVHLRVRPRGLARLLQPVIRRVMPRQAERTTTAMVDVIEHPSPA